MLSLVDILGNLCTNLLALLVSLPSFPPLLLFLFLGWSTFLLASFIFLTVTEQCEKKVEVFWFPMVVCSLAATGVRGRHSTNP